MEGLQIRPYAGESDIEDIVRIENAEFESDGVPGRNDVGSYRAYLGHKTDQFDPARDVSLAVVDGEVVGVATRQWRDNHTEDIREYRVDGAVHPDWRRRGIGSALLAHNEQRNRELAATHKTDRQLVFGSAMGGTQAGDRALLDANGYGEVRWFFDMTRPNLADAPEPGPLPEGLELRAITPDLYRPVFRALIEAFEDHWGGGDSSDEALNRYIESPGHDASLWIIAFDGDQIAGGVINGIEREENKALGVQRGWLHSVFTRRPWRKRGLASALVARSLILLRDRGMDAAVLGVDADNPTGALGLYERQGFKPSYRWTAWRKPLEG